MRRPRWGIDLDGIIYDYDRTVRYMLRTQFGYAKDGPLGEPATSWTSVQDKVTKHQWQWVWSKGLDDLFRHGHLYVGSILALRELAKMGDLVLITHRPKGAGQTTYEWIAYHKLPFSEVHLISNGGPKSAVTPHCDLYVDDKPENIVDFLTNTNAVSLLWRRPWNEDFIHSDRWPKVEQTGMYVDSWDEVVKYAKELSNAAIR